MKLKNLASPSYLKFVHYRVKNFIWRLAKNILPTRCNLLRKGVKLDPSCPLCNSEAETSNHLFMQCEIAKLVWFSSPLGIRSPSDIDVNDWLVQWLSCKDHFAAQLFCTTLWKLWSARNQCHFKHQRALPHVITAEALDFVLEFNKANSSRKRTRQQNPASVIEPIYKGFTTVQVDAGCYANGTVAMGCVIRNQTNDVILAASKRESIESDPATAEALAIRWGRRGIEAGQSNGAI
jgi:hypothetical protein